VGLLNGTNMKSLVPFADRELLACLLLLLVAELDQICAEGKVVKLEMNKRLLWLSLIN